MANQQKKSKKKGNQRTEKVTVENALPVRNGDFFEVVVEAEVVGVDGKLKVDCPLNATRGLKAIAPLTVTDSKGIGTFSLTFPIALSGKEVEIKIQIDGSPAKAYHKITLPVVFISGTSIDEELKTWPALIKENWPKKWQKIVVSFGLSIFLVFLGWLVFGQTVSIVFAILLALRFMVKGFGPFGWIVSFTVAAVILAIGFTSTFFVDPIRFALFWIVPVAFPFWVLEELVKKEKIEEKGVFEKARWNIFPTWPKWILGGIIIVLAANYFVGHNGGDKFDSLFANVPTMEEKFTHLFEERGLLERTIEGTKNFVGSGILSHVPGYTWVKDFFRRCHTVVDLAVLWIFLSFVGWRSNIIQKKEEKVDSAIWKKSGNFFKHLLGFLTFDEIFERILHKKVKGKK